MLKERDERGGYIVPYEPPLVAVKDYLVENLRGMCVNNRTGKSESCMASLELRDYCTACYAAAEIERLRAIPASASPGSGEGCLLSLKRAAMMLTKSLPDELVEALRAEWGNTNLAVLKYWRDELTAELSALPASEGQEPPAQKDQR